MNDTPPISAIKQTKDQTKATNKRFVFDVPFDQLKVKVSHSNSLKPIMSDSPIHIPETITFSDPISIEEAYAGLTEAILNMVKDIREFVATNCITSEASKNLRFEDPVSCVNSIKELFIGCCGRFRHDTNTNSTSDEEVNVYEVLLQKAEAKIRDLIRNEQIYRISFDQYGIKLEESEKATAELQERLEITSIVVEDLTRETKRVGELLHQKETELKTIRTESKSHSGSTNFSQCISPVSHGTPQSEQPKTKLRSLNLQNLNMTKSKLSDSSNSVSHQKSGRSVKKSLEQAGYSHKPKSTDRTGKSIGGVIGNILNVKISEADRLGLLNNQRQGGLTERLRTETLNENRLSRADNQSENYSVYTQSLSHSHTQPNLKKNSSQILLGIQESLSTRLSPQAYGTNKNNRLTGSDTKPKSISNMKLRSTEEAAPTYSSKLMTSRDSEPYSIYGEKLEKIDRKRTEEIVANKGSLKGVENHHLQTSASTTSLTKRKNNPNKPNQTEVSTESHDRSSDLKTAMANLAKKGKKTPNLGSQNVNKSPLKRNENTPKTIVNKENGKYVPSVSPGSGNTVFMNIMLKKLAGQKISPKKGM